MAAVINVTPGLDTMLVLRTSIAGGRATGLVSGLGITTGCLAWGVAAAAGATELLTASHAAYETLRITGAVYLGWLGCRALWRSRRGGAGQPPAEEPAGAGHRLPVPRAEAGSSRLAAFRSGLTTNLLNPKAGLFYMSLLPQFIPRGVPVFGPAMLLTLIDVGELLIWFCVLSAAASALTHRISRASFRRRMEQVSGLVFVGFAVNLAVDRS
ncbi:MAG TPA: LysE family translocator [Trebonia sp.]|nr:LysE family translocator [Trebonia sp.]